MKARRDWVLSLALNAVLAAAQGNLLLTDVNSGDDEGTWCLDSGYGGSNQVNVRMSRCTASSTSQLWLFDGSALKTEANSTWCLDWTWKPGRNNVHMSLCSQSSAHQRWRFDERFLKTDTGEADGAGAWCMDWTTRGQKDVYMNECSGVYPHQHWRWISSPSSSSSLADRLLPILFVLVPSVLVGSLLLGGLAYLCHKRVRRRRGPGYTSSTEIAGENSVQASNADVTHADVRPELTSVESMRVEVSPAPSDKDGEPALVSLRKELSRIIAELEVDDRIFDKYGTDVKQIIFGKAKASVLPIANFMCVDINHVLNAQIAPDEGLKAIEDEFKKHGTPVDKECFKYVRYGRTGDLRDRIWENGIIDKGREAGLDLEWFLDNAPADAKLTRGMVLALRLYTTAAYKSLNDGMRGELCAEKPHPFPVTVHLLTEGIKNLRAPEGDADTSNAKVTLWRGMRNLKLDNEFMLKGGSEKAPMSTSPSLEVAVRYSASACSVLLKLETSHFRNRGADISFLSAFPEECEVLYPPLTYLFPTGRKQTVTTEIGVTFTVVEVKPEYG